MPKKKEENASLLVGQQTMIQPQTKDPPAEKEHEQLDSIKETLTDELCSSVNDGMEQDESMSNLGTVVRVPNSLLSKSAPITKLQRPALEISNKSDSGASDVTLVPMMLTLFMVDKLVEGDCIEFKVW